MEGARRRNRGFRWEVAAIDRGTLSAVDRIHSDTFKSQLEERRDAFKSMSTFEAAFDAQDVFV